MQSSDKKAYNVSQGIRLTNEPDIFIGEDSPNNPRGLMSCGHAVLAQPLTQYIIKEVKQGKYEFFCPSREITNPNTICNKQWGYQEVKIMCQLDLAERQFVEEKMTENKLKRQQNIYECPKCRNYCTKTNNNNKSGNKIICRFCVLTGEQSEFCKLCLKTWITNLYDFCGNDECKRDFRIDILKSTLYYLFNGEKIPRIRGCPNCGLVLELNGFDYCRTLQCQCGNVFCFKCLNFTAIDSVSSPCVDQSYFAEIQKYNLQIPVCQLARIQTRLPVLKLNYQYSVNNKRQIYQIQFQIILVFLLQQLIFYLNNTSYNLSNF